MASTCRHLTLIELIAVMALLAVIMMIATPSLAGHFHGRSLTAEARRLVALTRYARSQAISRSEPMLLWLDSVEGRYGVTVHPSYATDEGNPLEFVVADDVALDVPLDGGQAEGVAEILFSPDGTIDSTSPESFSLYIRHGDSAGLTIVQAETRPFYQVEEVGGDE